MKLEFETHTSTVPHIEHNFVQANSETNAAKISQMLQTGIKAAQAGNRAEARALLLQVTEAEPQNETAWLWMASISEYPEELIIFLNNVLSINASNARALEWMKASKSMLAKTFVQRGVDATTDANLDFARQCFLQAIVHDAESESAWLHLASISDSADEKVAHLQKVLTLNPANEVAKDAMRVAKNQVVESLLRKANSTAVAGEREAARAMLNEVFKYAPELEEAWILKSYLADSFSEKITCFEKVLSLNPENEMAISGLASLRAMMAKTEAKRIEQAAMLAAIEKSTTDEVLVVSEEQIVYADDEDENSPTQELEYPPNFSPDAFENEGGENETPNPTNELTDAALDQAQQRTGDLPQEPEVAAQPNSEIEFTDYSHVISHSSEPREATQIEIVRTHEEFQPSSFAANYAETPNDFSSTASRNFRVDNLSKSLSGQIICPFCEAENEPNAFVCASCRTILSLADLEMLLAHTEAEREILSAAVERMEKEMTTRRFSAAEFKNLAIGQINLKNLRQGVTYLQKAAQIKPNDVVLASRINSLKIRLAEIEQQENSHCSIMKGKILVVDDSATVRKLISGKLEKSGHEVVCAVDGIEAMKKIKEFVPDLILLDIMMPQLDGYQVCKMIRTNELTKDVPVVMISGKDGFFDKVRGRMAGTTGYITKPFGPETLMKTVEAYIAQRGSVMPDAIEGQTASEE